MKWRALVSVVAIAVLASACGDDDDREAPTTTLGGRATAATTTTAAATTAAPTTAPEPLMGAGTTPVSVPAGAEGALLTQVRTGHQEGFDRVVFEFEGAEPPGYRVAYEERPVRQDGSGNEVDVAGEAVLLLRFENASGADITGAGLRETYTGPARISVPNPRSVVEAVRVGDFEGVLTWAVGVDGERPFKVSTLTSPARVIVDVAV